MMQKGGLLRGTLQSAEAPKQKLKYQRHNLAVGEPLETGRVTTAMSSSIRWLFLCGIC
jgi:hypothetical protein